MRLQVSKNDGTLRFVLEGRLDLAGVQAINDQFTFQLASCDGPVTVDLSKVAFVASLGMGLLVSAAKTARRRGHVLTLLSPQPMVEEMLRTAGIHHVVPIVHGEAGPSRS